ncbi:hypothetical protein [Synechococcus phage Ssp-JY39]
MWLYVPNISTSSQSVPEAAGSILASDWRFQALEASVWWRGKPSPSRSWYRRSGKVSFIRLLCGAMPEPSTAAHGVAAWTASLAASRANRIASPAASAAASTTATCGPTPAGSSSSRDAGSSSSRTWPGCSRRGLTKSLEPKEFGETFVSLVSRWRADCSRRRKLATRRNGNGLSSSAWPTASATFLTGDDADLFQQRAARLREKHKGRTGNGAGMTLATAAQNWPAPAARDHKGANGPNHMLNGSGRLHLDQLPNFVAFLWKTPRAHEVGQYTRDHGDPTKERLSLTGQACSLPVPTTTTDGAASSTLRRSLNPLFVEWLMGWPPGWTLLAWTDFACSATELSRFKQLMRSALSQLASPAEAPPAQLALFG